MDSPIQNARRAYKVRTWVRRRVGLGMADDKETELAAHGNRIVGDGDV